jgi:hypothetical protein
MKMLKAVLALFELGALGPMAGCAGPLARAESQFAEGHYPAAKQAFVSLETQSAAWAGPERAEYALYRGLTHAALGDRAHARQWLRDAQAIEDGHPSSLSRQDVQRLKVGLDSLGSE